MEKETKHHLIIAVTTVTLFAVLMNLRSVLGVFRELLGLGVPIFAGCILALFISVPMNGIKKRLNRFFAKTKKQPSKQGIHTMSFILTIIGVLAVLLVVLILLIPELVRSSQKLYMQIEASIPVWYAYLDSQQIYAGWLKELLSDINIKQMMQQVSDGLHVFLPNVAGAISLTVNVAVTAAFAVIISIYIVLGQDWVCRHAEKVVCAYLKPTWSAKLLRFSRMFYCSFTKFLSGQCGEAVILGTLMFAAFTIFGLPYGSLVGVLTAVCAIIPYVGAFISCGISILLTTLLDPTLSIRCAVVYFVVQFIENQFIYPRVVGESVGLPPLYTLIAAMVGGELFGIIGIIFFIPLTAVVTELVKEDVNERLNHFLKDDE